MSKIYLSSQPRVLRKPPCARIDSFPEIFGMFDATDVTSANGIEALFQTAPEALAQIVGACGM